MMLCQRKGRNDPEDLEGVLPVLDRRLYDGGDGGVVLRAGFRAEASADLEFGLGRPQGLLAVVVRGRDGGVREEGEDVVPVFGDAFFELVQFGAVPVLFRVDRRPRQQFVQPRLHILPRPRPDFPHEVGRPAVRHPDGPALLLRREVPVHHVVAPAFVKGQIGRGLVLEGPEPAVLSAHVDPRLIRSGNLSGRDLPADHLVRLLRDPLHGVQHVGHGPLADVEPKAGLEQVREPLERDVLIGAEVRGERHDVGAEGYRGVHVLGEPALAAVAAGALHPHLEMPRHRRHDRKRDVHHLPRGGDCRGFHVRRFAAHGTDGRGIPALRPGHIPGLQPRAALMPPLPAGLPAGGLPLGLRVRNAYRVPGGRDTAVGAGLRNGFGSALKFRDPGFEFLYLLVPADKVAVQDIDDKGLRVKFLRELRGVEILGEPHFPKE